MGKWDQYKVADSTANKWSQYAVAPQTTVPFEPTFDQPINPDEVSPITGETGVSIAADKLAPNQNAALTASAPQSTRMLQGADVKPDVNQVTSGNIPSGLAGIANILLKGAGAPYNALESASSAVNRKIYGEDSPMYNANMLPFTGMNKLGEGVNNILSNSAQFGGSPQNRELLLRAIANKIAGVLPESMKGAVSMTPEQAKYVNQTGENVATGVGVGGLLAGAGEVVPAVKTAIEQRPLEGLSKAYLKFNRDIPVPPKELTRFEDMRRMTPYIRDAKDVPLTKDVPENSVIHQLNERKIPAIQDKIYNETQDIISRQKNVYLPDAGNEISSAVQELRNPLTKNIDLLKDKSIIDEAQKWENHGGATIGELADFQRHLNDNLHEFYKKNAVQQTAIEGKAMPIAEMEKAVDAIREIIRKGLNSVGDAGNHYSELQRDYGAVARIKAATEGTQTASEAGTAPLLERVSDRVGSTGRVYASVKPSTLFPKIFNPNRRVYGAIQAMEKYGGDLLKPPSAPQKLLPESGTPITIPKVGSEQGTSLGTNPPIPQPVPITTTGFNQDLGMQVHQNLRDVAMPTQEANHFASKAASGIPLTKAEVDYVNRHSPATYELFRKNGLLPKAGELPEFASGSHNLPPEATSNVPSDVTGNVSQRAPESFIRGQGHGFGEQGLDVQKWKNETSANPEVTQWVKPQEELPSFNMGGVVEKFNRQADQSRNIVTGEHSSPTSGFEKYPEAPHAPFSTENVVNRGSEASFKEASKRLKKYLSFPERKAVEMAKATTKQEKYAIDKKYQLINQPNKEFVEGYIAKKFNRPHTALSNFTPDEWRALLKEAGKR